MDAIKTVLGSLLAFIQEVFVAIGLDEGVAAIEEILAKFAA
ncbi:MAG: hypothetical protein UHM85_03865 [Acutalibacteraceae bacterium]|nr:hypothetical protein [Acutalibacteraceae bacterium]